MGKGADGEKHRRRCSMSLGLREASPCGGDWVTSSKSARAVTLHLCRLLEVTPRTRPAHGECARHCFRETLDATNGREPDAINGGSRGGSLQWWGVSSHPQPVMGPALERPCRCSYVKAPVMRNLSRITWAGREPNGRRPSKSEVEREAGTGTRPREPR